MELYQQQHNGSIDSKTVNEPDLRVAAFTFDAVWSLALALNASQDIINSGTVEDAFALHDNLLKTEFLGLTVRNVL